MIEIKTDSTLLSINSITSKGVTKYTLCVYYPEYAEKPLKEWLNKEDKRYLSVIKKTDLTPLYVNHLSESEAKKLKGRLRKELNSLNIPFVEYKGRHKNQDDNTSSPQGNPWGLPSCGLKGIPNPWYLNPKKLEEMQRVVKPLSPIDITIGERAENLLVNAIKEIAPSEVTITQATRGSILDVKGKDLVVSIGKLHYSLQVKSSAIDAALHASKYPNSAVVWIDPGENPEQIHRTAKQIGEITWQKHTKYKAATAAA